MPGVHEFRIGVGDDPQVFVVGGLPKLANTPDVATLARQLIDAARRRGATVEDEGGTTICGTQPAWRWTVHYPTSPPKVAHFLTTAVPNGFATGTYMHRDGVADRDDALAALTELCVEAPAAPKTPLPTPTIIATSTRVP